MRPRVIMLENVEEFADWGPLTPDGKPCQARRGMTFRRWVRQLERLGYTCDTCCNGEEALTRFAEAQRASCQEGGETS